MHAHMHTHAGICVLLAIFWLYMHYSVRLGHAATIVLYIVSGTSPFPTLWVEIDCLQSKLLLLPTHNGLQPAWYSNSSMIAPYHVDIKFLDISIWSWTWPPNPIRQWNLWNFPYSKTHLNNNSTVSCILCWLWLWNPGLQMPTCSHV